MNSTWHVLGAGAIGSLWACHLVSARFPVTLILRSQAKLDQFSALAGIELNQQLYKVGAELASTDQPIDLLLVTTKAPDTAAALQSVAPRIHADTRILVLQNGMGSQQWVTENFPDNEVIWASTTDGAWLSAPFKLTHAGQGITKIGLSNSNPDWLQRLQKGFLQLETDSDIATTLWRKLAINCAINPLTAIHNCQNGELVKNPNYLAEMVEVCQEVEKVATTLQIDLFDTPLIEHACRVAELTASNFSSMCQDIRHERITEIDFITGYVCQLAERQGIDIAKNLTLLKEIKKMQENS